MTIEVIEPVADPRSARQLARDTATPGENVVMRFGDARVAALVAATPDLAMGLARQVLAGAVVIEAVMDLVGIQELIVCPWALREGIILQHLDLIPAPNGG